MKMFYIPGLRQRTSRPVDTETIAAWRRDPLSHPALSGMNERGLADLPLGRPRPAVRDGDAKSCAC